MPNKIAIQPKNRVVCPKFGLPDQTSGLELFLVSTGDFFFRSMPKASTNSVFFNNTKISKFGRVSEHADLNE